MYSAPSGLLGEKPTLGRLLSERDLELQLLSGHGDLTNREMRGIHFTEILEPIRWLAEGWIMMTTGIYLRRDPHAQRLLVQDLVTVGAGGLGYSLDIVSKSVPRALLEEARRLNLPLFSIPLHVAARDVTTRANRMILAADATMFHQALSAQEVFFEHFDASMRAAFMPEIQLMDNLRGLLKMPALFHSTNAVQSTTDPRIRHLLRAAPSHAPTEQRFNGANFLIVPCKAGSVFVGWIVVELPPDMHDGQLLVNTILAAARLVALAVLSRKHRAVKGPKLRQELMARLLHVAPPAEQKILAPVEELSGDGALAMLHELGFRPGTALRAVVADAGPHAEMKTFGGMLQLFSRAAVPHVYLLRDMALQCVVQASSTDLCELLKSSTVPTGVGGEVSDFTRIDESLRQASAALRFIHARHAPGSLSESSPPIAVFDHLPLSTWMCHQAADSPVAMAKAKGLLQGLVQNPPVLETLLAYLRNDLDIGRCATELFLHPNTVRYRLAKAEALLDAPLHSPAAIADIFQALTIVGYLK